MKQKTETAEPAPEPKDEVQPEAEPEPVKPKTEPAPEPKEEAPEKKEEVPAEEIVKISDLSYYKDMEVVVECELSLTKTAEEEGKKLYGYSLRDGTGEVMMTSTEEIKDKTAKLRCQVKESGDGKVYLRYVRTE